MESVSGILERENNFYEDQRGRLDTSLSKTKIERLERLDWIPIISTITGLARLIFGGFQVAFGLIMLFPEIAYRLLMGSSISYSMNSVTNGIQNIFRGCVAAVPGVNLALFFYDNSICRVR